MRQRRFSIAEGCRPNGQCRSQFSAKNGGYVIIKGVRRKQPRALFGNSE